MTSRLFIAALTLSVVFFSGCNTGLDLGNSDAGSAGGGSAGGGSGTGGSAGGGSGGGSTSSNPGGGSGGGDGGGTGGGTAGGTGGGTAGGTGGGTAGGSGGGTAGGSGGGTAGGSGGGTAGGSGGGTAGGSGGGTAGGTGGGTAGGSGGGTAGGSGGGSGGGPVDANVYMTDDKALYRFDVAANTITKVGTYNCFTGTNAAHTMFSLALDSAGNMYGTTIKANPPGQGSNAFVKINRLDASCTFVKWTTNSVYAAGMAFFPAGMVDTGEALVAIDNGEYYQINPATGAITHLGDFAGSGQQNTYFAEGGLTAANGKAYTRAFVAASGFLQVAEFDPILGHFKRLLSLNNFPDRCLGLFRLGNALYTYGTKTGSTDKFFKIDLSTEKVTAMPNPTGVTTLYEPSIAVAPSVP